MWTYNPQKRQAGKAFALAYILRLRSCRLLGVFVISPPRRSEGRSAPSGRRPREFLRRGPLRSSLGPEPRQGLGSVLNAGPSYLVTTPARVTWTGRVRGWILIQARRCRA